MNRGRLAASLAVVAAAACFGTLGPVSRLAYDRGMTPLALVAWRSGLGALFGILVVARSVSRGERVGLRGLSRRGWATLSAASITGLIVNLAVFMAFARTTVALVLLAFYTYPAIVSALAIARGSERLDRARAIALAMALAGMVLVVVSQLDPSSGITFDSVGILLALAAAVCQAITVHLGRRGSIPIPAGQLAVVLMVTAAIGYVAIAAATGALGPVALPLGAPGTWPFVVFAGIVGAGIPSFLFFGGIRQLGSVRTSILAMFEPVVGVTLAAIVLGQAILPVQVAGGALILVAGALLQRSSDELPVPSPVPEVVPTTPG